MEAPPRPRRLVEWEDASAEQDGSRVVIHAPRGRFLAAVARLLGRGPTVRLRLDEVGSRIWILMDGERDTEEIVHAVQAGYGPEDPSIPQRVMTYLQRLARDRLITFEEQP